MSETTTRSDVIPASVDTTWYANYALDAVAIAKEPSPRSYVKNCLLVAREGEQIFDATTDFGPEVVLARLNGYAILPREQYDAIVGAAHVG